jgi:3-oxoacyl-[acyl-carrier protein] reductase
MKGDLLAGKICLVTGANSGIGLAVARKFAEHEAVVYANIRSQETASQEFLELCKAYANVKPLYFDVTDNDGVKTAISGIKKEEGRIDVLVNNAGVVTYELLGMINFSAMSQMFDVNVFAVIRLIQLVSRLMTRQRSGSVINISSIVGVQGVKGQLSYAATKGAINAITLSAAKELAASKIRVNAIAPGMVETPRLKKVLDEKFSDRISDIGFGRMALPEEIADTCLYLASDMSTYVTGQIIGVDGSTVL